MEKGKASVDDAPLFAGLWAFYFALCIQLTFAFSSEDATGLLPDTRAFNKVNRVCSRRFLIFSCAEPQNGQGLGACCSCWVASAALPSDDNLDQLGGLNNCHCANFFCLCFNRYPLFAWFPF